MKAVIIKGAQQVAVEERPRPTIEKDTDVIIKTRYAGLCGEQACLCDRVSRLETNSRIRSPQLPTDGRGDWFYPRP